MRAAEAAVQQAFARGVQAHQAGDVLRAVGIYRSVLADHPDHPGATLYLGVAYHDQGQPAEAISCIRRAIALGARSASAWNHLGVALQAAGDNDAAREAYATALRIDPGYAHALANLGAMERQAGELTRAAELLQQAIGQAPTLATAHFNLALVRVAEKRMSAAAGCLERAAALDPSHAATPYQLGLVYEIEGRAADAADQFRRAIHIDPYHAPALAALIALPDAPDDPALVERAIGLMGVLRPEDDRRALLGYALGKQHDRTGDPAGAFAMFQIANDCRRARHPYRRDLVETQFARYRASFPPAMWRRADGLEGQPRPLFIIGLPRTGTTLTERILAAHPMVLAAGERPDLPRLTARMVELSRGAMPFPECASAVDSGVLRALAQDYLALLPAAQGRQVTTDKNPFNFLNVGIASMMFRNATFVHCHRNPMAVALSCFMEAFDLRHDFTNHADDFAHYCAQYRCMMQHWKDGGAAITDLAYEQLVAEPDSRIPALLAEVGLDFDEACLAPDRQAADVFTPSKWQVRKPIHTGSTERWRRYGSLLDPLRAALERAGIDPEGSLFA